MWGYKGILPAGVKQGDLGDCWLLSAASALAENPERIKKLFDNEEYSANGMFTVNFFLRGKPIKVTIDDRLPYSDNMDMLVNARKSDNSAYWVPLLEKAYAKFFMNYETLDGGNMVESFRTLTGMPILDYSHSKHEADDLFKLITKYDEANWLITASNIEKLDGFPGNHAYTVLGVHTLTDCNGNEVEKLIKMRNPWSSEQYTGPWNDNDDRWNDFYLNQVDHTKRDEGVFYMPMTNFAADFRSTYIAMYEDWKINRIDAKWDRVSNS